MFRKITSFFGLGLFLMSSLAYGISGCSPSSYAWCGSARRMWQVTLQKGTLKAEHIDGWPSNAVKSEAGTGPSSLGTLQPEVVQLTSDYEVTSRFAGTKYKWGVRRTPVLLNQHEAKQRLEEEDEALRFPFAEGSYLPGQAGIYLSRQLQWSELSVSLITVVLGSVVLTLAANWRLFIRFAHRLARRPPTFEVIVKDKDLRASTLDERDK